MAYTTVIRPREPVMARVKQVIDYLFYVAYALLGLRFALSLIGARRGNAFVRFIAALTEPLYAPFQGIVKSARLDSDQILELSLVVAVVVYLLLHLAITGLLRLIAYRRATV